MIDGRATTVFLLTAKKKDFPFTKATLWIGKSDALIWQLETTEDTGMLRRVRSTSVQISRRSAGRRVRVQCTAGASGLSTPNR